MEFGLIGKSLSHSFSKGYFEKKFAAEGLNHQYHNCELASIKDFPALLEKADWRGFNVTIPYKEEILTYVDWLSPEVEQIGACNTLLLGDKGLEAYNTDYLGFAQSLKQSGWQASLKRALVLGNGGASKAVVYALEKESFKVDLVSRKAEPGLLQYSQAQSLISHYDLVVNTTPLGTYPDMDALPPLRPEGNLKGKLFYDLIYNPAQSKWLHIAAQRGAHTLNGLAMLHAQAEASWKLWTKD